MSTKTNLIVDAAIFAGFLVAFEPRLTGIPIHEWLSLAVFGVIVAHLALHWRWVIQITRTFFKKLIHSSRLNYVLNAALLVAFMAMMLSGVLISRSVLPFFGLQAVRDQFWRVLHTVSANASLALIAAHFALHWEWIVNAVKRYAVSPMLKLFRRPAAPRRAPLPIRPQDVRSH